MKFEGLSEGEGPDTRKVVDTLPLAGPNPVRDQLAPGVIKRGEKKLDHIKGVKTNKITLLTKTFHEGCLIYLLQSQKRLHPVDTILPHSAFKVAERWEFGSTTPIYIPAS